MDVFIFAIEHIFARYVKSCYFIQYSLHDSLIVYLYMYTKQMDIDQAVTM